MDPKIDYFIERTERDFDDLKEAIDSLNEKLDSINEKLSMRIDTHDEDRARRAGIVAGVSFVISLLTSLMAAWMGHGK